MSNPMNPIGGAIASVVNASKEQSEDARATLAAGLTPALEAAAIALRDQPLAITALAAKMLVEQLAAVDRDAALTWLRAVRLEHDADNEHQREHAISLRGEAFTRLAQAAAQLDRDKPHGPLNLRLFI